MTPPYEQRWVSTMAPSDSRWPPSDFTTGLYRRSLLTRLPDGPPVPNHPLRTCRSPTPEGPGQGHVRRDLGQVLPLP